MFSFQPNGLVSRGKKMEKLQLALKVLEDDRKFKNQEWQFYKWLVSILRENQDPALNFIAEKRTFQMLDFQYNAMDDELFTSQNNLIQLNDDFQEQLGTLYFGGEISIFKFSGIILQSQKSNFSIVLLRDIKYPIINKFFCLDDGTLSNTTQIIWLNFAKFKIPLFDWQNQKILEVNGINEKFIEICLDQCINDDYPLPKDILEMIRRTRSKLKINKFKFLDSLEQQRNKIEFQMMENQSKLFPGQMTWSQFDTIIAKLSDPKCFRQFKKLLLSDGTIQTYRQWMWTLAVPSKSLEQIKNLYREGLLQLQEGSALVDDLITSVGIELEDQYIDSCYQNTLMCMDDLQINKVIKLLPLSKKPNCSSRYFQTFYSEDAKEPIYYMSKSGRIPIEIWFFEECQIERDKISRQIFFEGEFSYQGYPIIQMMQNIYSYRYMWLHCISQCSFKGCQYCQNSYKFCRIYVLARLVALKTQNCYGLGICTECGQPFTSVKGIQIQKISQEKLNAFYKYTSKLTDELQDFLSLNELEALVELLYHGENYIQITNWEELDDSNIDLELVLMYAWAVENQPQNQVILMDGFRNLMKSKKIYEKLRNLKKLSTPPSILSTFTRYENLLRKITMKQEWLEENNKFIKNFIIINPDQMRMVKSEQNIQGKGTDQQQQQNQQQQRQQGETTQQSKDEKPLQGSGDLQAASPATQVTTTPVKKQHGQNLKEQEEQQDNNNEAIGCATDEEQKSQDEEIFQSAEGQLRLKDLREQLPYAMIKQMQLKQLQFLQRMNENDKIIEKVIELMEKYEWIVLQDIVEYQMKELKGLNEHRIKILEKLKQDSQFIARYEKLYNDSMKSKKIRKLAKRYENFKKRRKAELKQQQNTNIQTTEMVHADQIQKKIKS